MADISDKPEGHFEVEVKKEEEEEEEKEEEEEEEEEKKEHAERKEKSDDQQFANVKPDMSYFDMKAKINYDAPNDPNLCLSREQVSGKI